jgi:hypothetical protein
VRLPSWEAKRWNLGKEETPPMQTDEHGFIPGHLPAGRTGIRFLACLPPVFLGFHPRFSGRFVSFSCQNSLWRAYSPYEDLFFNRSRAILRELSPEKPCRFPNDSV